MNELIVNPFREEQRRVLMVIEKKLGRYKKKPEIAVVDELYEQSGALGQTWLKDGVPFKIFLDSRLLNDREGYLWTATHEVLEWRLRELGEKYSHAQAEALNREVLNEAKLLPQDWWSQLLVLACVLVPIGVVVGALAWMALQHKEG